MKTRHNHQPSNPAQPRPKHCRSRGFAGLLDEGPCPSRCSLWLGPARGGRGSAGAPCASCYGRLQAVACGCERVLCEASGDVGRMGRRWGGQGGLCGRGGPGLSAGFEAGKTRGRRACA